jgi:hypothetical protein
MANSSSSPVSTMIAFLTLAGTSARKIQTFTSMTGLLFAVTCVAQDQPQTSPGQLSQPGQTQVETENTTATIPAGTRIALVLTHPIQSRYIHRGDDIYAQVSSPVNTGNQIVIPPGTFVQGKVDKLERKGGRAELRLQSMSISFPDGYVAPVRGPMILESDEGYALKDPGSGRMIGAFALPAAGLGLGALIGHSAASSQPSTLTSSLPPGCVGPPPGCISSSLTTPASKLKSTAIGSMVGLAAGGVASIALLVNTHHFFLDVWSPVEMVVQHPITLRQNEVSDAVRQSEQHPAPQPPIAARPRAIPPPPSNPDHGTCYTPGTPGTPDTVIPGPPGPDGMPGPSTVIPGTPPIPGTPYPCP